MEFDKILYKDSTYKYATKLITFTVKNWKLLLLIL
jgi:hypothetical protein